MKKIFAFIFFVLALTACNKEFKLKIYHFNDSHAHIEASNINLNINNKHYVAKVGGYSAISNLVNTNKPVNSLFLNAGDVFQGTLYFNKYKGLADAEVLNTMKLDAMCLGNHEFDDGIPTLLKFAKLAKFSVLSCNINTKNLQNIYPYKIFNINNQKIAVVGVTTIDSNIDTTVTNLYSPYKSLEKIIKNDLKEKQNINKIIVLSHCGLETDKKIAKTIDDIDVIIGGHSHTLLGDYSKIGIEGHGKYPTIVKSPSNKDVLIVQVGSNSLVLGQLELIFDKNGEIKNYKANPVLPILNLYKNQNKNLVEVKSKALLDSIYAIKCLQKAVTDKNTEEKISKYRKQLDEFRNEILIDLPKSYLHVRIPGWKHSTGKIMHKGSQLAPLICKAFKFVVNNAGYKIDAVIENAGGIRQDLKKGIVKVNDVYKILPYENEIVIMDISGKNLIDGITYAFNMVLNKHRSGEWLYYDNLKCEITNQKISGIKIKVNNKWQNINKTKQYKVATNAYISKSIKPFAKSKKIYKTSITDVIALSEYLKKYENK